MLKKSRWLNMVINLEIKENLVHKSIQFPLLTGRLNQPHKHLHRNNNQLYRKKFQFQLAFFGYLQRKGNWGQSRNIDLPVASR